MLASWDLLFAGVFLALFVAIAIYGLAIPAGDRRWWLLAACLVVLVLAGSLAAEGLVRVLLLDAAGCAAVALVWTRGTPQAAAVARTYLALLVAAALCIIAGMALGGLLGAGGGQAPGQAPGQVPTPPLDRLALGLLIAGFALKLALAPVYFWLPGVAEHAAPMTTALIVSVVDIAAFSELAHLRLAAPWLFGHAGWLWLAIALLSMFGGALLALAQRDLKRMLAFSTIDDMGYLLLGVVAGPGVGLTGALAGALSHALFKVMLFGSVGVVERGNGKALTLDGPESRGLLARYPVAGAAFLAGAFGMIGVPPLFGFAGRWRLYLAGLQYGGFWLALAMVAATGLALLYYVRAAHRVWFGPAPAPAAAAASAAAAAPARTGGEPRLAAAVLLVLIVISLALGLAPALATSLLP